MREDNSDKLQSIYSVASDLARFAFLIALKGSVSEDRKNMMVLRAKQISEWAAALEAE